MPWRRSLGHGPLVDDERTPESHSPVLNCSGRFLTAKRWHLLKALCGAGPVSIREAARRAGRDVKAVHGDVTALLDAGILSRDARGRIVFPFDAVKVAFLLQAAS